MKTNILLWLVLFLFASCGNESVEVDIDAYKWAYEKGIVNEGVDNFVPDNDINQKEFYEIMENFIENLYPDFYKNKINKTVDNISVKYSNLFKLGLIKNNKIEPNKLITEKEMFESIYGLFFDNNSDNDVIIWAKNNELISVSADGEKTYLR